MSALQCLLTTHYRSYYTSAFARYGAKLTNPQWSVSAFGDDGCLVLSLWQNLLKRTSEKSHTGPSGFSAGLGAILIARLARTTRHRTNALRALMRIRGTRSGSRLTSAKTSSTVAVAGRPAQAAMSWAVGARYAMLQDPKARASTWAS